MTGHEMLPLLRDWAARHAALAAQMDLLQALTLASPESPLLSAVWMTFDGYTSALSRLIGDQSEWLHWYCWENDMGSKGMTVHIDRRTLKCKTLEQLARVIGGPL